MKCYKVTYDNGTRTIMAFGPSSRIAARLFSYWRDFTLACTPGTFTLERVQASRLTGELRPLRNAMEAGLSGIGILDPKEGWIILPPEDERVKT